MQTRDYAVDISAKHGGDECPVSEERVCNTQSCPIDCKVSAWTSYSACTKSCGTGSKTKSRSL
jgi:hypothetical protein